MAAGFKLNSSTENWSVRDTVKFGDCLSVLFYKLFHGGFAIQFQEQLITVLFANRNRSPSM